LSGCQLCGDSVLRVKQNGVKGVISGAMLGLCELSSAAASITFSYFQPDTEIAKKYRLQIAITVMFESQ